MSIWPWSQNQLLKKALAMYAGEHVLQRVLRDGTKALALDSDYVNATVVFFDADPIAMRDAALLASKAAHLSFSAYYEIVSKLVIEHQGALDAFYGDEAMAWWTSATHASDAITCALAVAKAIASIGTGADGKDMIRLKACIGAASNPMRIGTYGSSSRLRYVPFGESTNLASRLSRRSNREYPYPVVIEECTLRLLGPKFEVKLIESVNIKGTDRQVLLYGLGEGDDLQNNHEP